MISPPQATDLAHAVAEVYAEAEYQLAASIARRTVKGISETDWALIQQREIQLFRREAEQLMNRVTNAGGEATQKAIEGAAQIGQGEAAREIASIIKKPIAVGTRRTVPAAISLMASEARYNLAKTTPHILRSAEDDYRQIVARVAGNVVTGALTQRQALQQALNEFSAKGIKSFRDRAGREWSMAAYAEMATRTATTRALVAAHTDQLVAEGYNLVIVSDNPQECKLCRPFEGKVLSIGPGKVQSKRVFDTLDNARSEGLYHPNCRHSHTLYQPGITKPPQDTADPQGEKDRDKLRYLERQVRGAKMREATAVTPEGAAKAKAQIKYYQSLIKQHTDTTSAKRRRDREQLLFGRAGEARPAVTLPKPARPVKVAPPAPKPEPKVAPNGLEYKDPEKIGLKAVTALPNAMPPKLQKFVSWDVYGPQKSQLETALASTAKKKPAVLTNLDNWLDKGEPIETPVQQSFSWVSQFPDQFKPEVGSTIRTDMPIGGSGEFRVDNFRDTYSVVFPKGTKLSPTPQGALVPPRGGVYRLAEVTDTETMKGPAKHYRYEFEPTADGKVELNTPPNEKLPKAVTSPVDELPVPPVTKPTITKDKYAPKKEPINLRTTMEYWNDPTSVKLFPKVDPPDPSKFDLLNADEKLLFERWRQEAIHGLDAHNQRVADPKSLTASEKKVMAVFKPEMTKWLKSGKISAETADQIADKIVERVEANPEWMADLPTKLSSMLNGDHMRITVADAGRFFGFTSDSDRVANILAVKKLKAKYDVDVPTPKDQIELERVHKLAADRKDQYLAFDNDSDAQFWASDVWRLGQQEYDTPELNAAHKLTQAEEDALHYYTTDTGYERTNDTARGFLEPVPANLKRVREIDSAIQRAPAVPQDLMVHRNVGADAFGIGPNGNLQSLLEQTVEERGFMSTSLNQRAAMNDGLHNVRLHLRVPQGTKGIYLSGRRGQLGVSKVEEAEAELLLARNTQYKITRVEWIAEESRWDVEAEVVGQ